MPKARGQKKRKMLRHDPLATQIEESSLRAEGRLRPVRGDNDEPRVDGSAAVEEVVLGRARRKQALKKKKRVAQTLVVDKKEYVSAKMTRKILQQAREQQDDEQRQEEQIDDDDDDDDDDGDGDDGDDGAGVGGIDGTSTELFPALGSIQEGVEQEGGDEEGDRGDAHSAGEKEEAHAAGEETSFEYLDEGQISAEDERILAMFRPGGSGGPAPKAKTLSDYIMEKIHEKEEGAVADGTISATPAVSSLDPKVVEVFKGVGRVLEKHRSGQLPKAFKIIPTLRNWEEILALTCPDNWTPATMFAATRLFASNLNERMAQRFYYLVLLPTLEADIERNQKLNYHYYQALTKAAFKPAAFFRGILLPLCSSSCSLRKAVIFASVVAKTSIPVLHSAVALMKLAEMPYSGVASLFIRVLCDKKYALPHRVLDALVAHFVRTAQDPRGNLPVLWHQSLLTFAQRYKHELTDRDREQLKPCLRLQAVGCLHGDPNRWLIVASAGGLQEHGEITREIRRELFAAQGDSQVSRGGGGGGAVPMAM